MPKSAIIPTDDGGRLILWTCSKRADGGYGACHGDSISCHGDCQRTHKTEARGDPESAAIQHVINYGMLTAIVHVVNSGCRGQHFKVWLGGNGYVAREII